MRHIGGLSENLMESVLTRSLNSGKLNQMPKDLSLTKGNGKSKKRIVNLTLLSVGLATVRCYVFKDLLETT